MKNKKKKKTKKNDSSILTFQLATLRDKIAHV